MAGAPQRRVATYKCAIHSRTRAPPTFLLPHCHACPCATHVRCLLRMQKFSRPLRGGRSELFHEEKTFHGAEVIDAPGGS